MNQEIITKIAAETESAVRDLVAQRIRAGGSAVAVLADEREYADVSAAVTIEPNKVHVEGWITFADSKLYFVVNQVHSTSGAFAGGGAMFHMSVMRRDRIKKDAHFKVEAFGLGGAGGALNLWIDGELVFGPLVLAGAGWGLSKAEGTVRFERHG